jgi:RNA polymerase sigma-70 factor (sigma-E family)
MGRGRVAETDLGPVRIEGGKLSDLYRLYADEAVRLAYLITGDHVVAEDLVQDAFVKLAGRLVHLREAGAFEAYLRRTVVNLANSHFRRRMIERRYEEREASMLALPRHDPDIPTRVAARAALLELPVRQRTAIVLRFYVDLSEGQTAELMGCRTGTVKALVSQGMDKLRPLMAGV